MVNILLIAGTSREGRESIKVVNYIKKIISEDQNIKLSFADPMEIRIQGDGDELKDPKFTELTKNADAFIIVAPEYNHSFPGSLKRLLDSEFENYNHKPVLLAGVSSGPWGGVRCVESLIHFAKAVGMILLKKDLYFPKVSELFGSNGDILNKDYDEIVKSNLNELIFISKKMKSS